jgi:hypothetical protein
VSSGARLRKRREERGERREEGGERKVKICLLGDMLVGKKKEKINHGGDIKSLSSLRETPCPPWLKFLWYAPALKKAPSE